MSLRSALSWASALGGVVFLLVVVLACGSGDGTAACTKPAAGTHAVLVPGFSCQIECSPGFFDCDNSISTGCESTAPCNGSFDGSPPITNDTTHLVTTLAGYARGIAVCGGQLVFFDDGTLRTASSKVFSLSGEQPAGGLVCEGSNVYFATLSDGDAGPTGSIYRFHLGDTAPQKLVSNVDPARGIDVRASTVYWVERTSPNDAGPMLAFTTDAGWGALLPAMESTTYKPFALTSDADYALSGGAIWTSSLDGGAPTTLDFDASTAHALLAVDASIPVVVTGNGDAGDSVIVPDDASTLVTQIPKIVATASFGKHAIFATDDTVYEWTYGANVKVLAQPYLHISDVALDDTHAYWVTRGLGATPGAVWKAPL